MTGFFVYRLAVGDFVFRLSTMIFETFTHECMNDDRRNFPRLFHTCALYALFNGHWHSTVPLYFVRLRLLFIRDFG